MSFLHGGENMTATGLLNGALLYDLRYPQKRQWLSYHTIHDSAMDDTKSFNESLCNLLFYAVTTHTCLRILKKE